MEEQIKYILDMSCEHFVAMPSKCKQRAARETTSHVMKFIEWKDFGNHPFISWFDEAGNYYTDEVSDKHWSLNDLYLHWLNNINNK